MLATGPGETAIRFDLVEDPALKPLTDYIASGWVTGLRPETIRPLSVNGLQAATARASADRWDFDVTVVRSGSQIYRFLTAVPKGATALLDATSGTMRQSFRKMSPAEIAGLKPLRIRIVTVGPADTVLTMAAG